MKMPSKKKKYNARFPAGRIKKIMQSDEEIGKVAQAVPVIILKITNSRNAKTLSPSHMKQCIMAENRFDFLRELVKNVPDICVAEDVSNDSSPEATIDPSDNPYDLSMPSTSNSNETITQKTMPSNGSISLLRNNGVTRSCGTTIVAISQQSAKLNAGPSEESRKAFKRQWEVVNRSQKPLQTPSLRNIPNRSISIVECVPPKLSRSESAPAGSKISELQLSLSALSTTSQQHHKQQLQHQQQSNEILPTDLRRLKHQPKSSPFDLCIATAPTELKSTNNNNNNNNIKLPQTPTAIPAPIVSTDFVNTPIVKIDYSNLALHDTSYSESPTSSSSSSPSVDKSVKCIANTQIQKTPPASTSTLAALATAESPVINIDLSNIVTSGTISASSNFAPVAMPTATVIVPPSPATTSKQNSYLELDEDYDNI